MKSAYGPRFRPKHATSPEKRAARVGLATQLSLDEAEETRLLEPLGDPSARLTIDLSQVPYYLELLTALGVKYVTVPHRERGPKHWMRRDDMALVSMIRQCAPRGMAPKKIGKRLRKHMKAIYVTIALGDDIDDTIVAMIRAALKH